MTMPRRTAASRQNAPPRVGGARPSQLMFTHGVGSLVDMPNISTVIAGLDEWDIDEADTITEDRLLAAVRAVPGLGQVETFKSPPWRDPTPNPFDGWARVGVPVFPFPRWLRCTACNRLAPVESKLFKLELNPFHLDRTRYSHDCRSGKKAALVVPARFVTACPAGHLDEFPWEEFCHTKAPCSGSPRLRVNEIGGGSRSTDVQVECLECGQKMHVSQAFGEPGERLMPRCRGRHPHLRRFDHAPCAHQARAVLLGASNAWFPITRRALSLPVAGDVLDRLVAERWGDLGSIASLEELKGAVKYGPQFIDLRGEDLDVIWAIIQARRQGDRGPSETDIDLLAPEWRLLSKPADATPSNDFRVREVATPTGLGEFFERVVLADRLRVVAAQCGFTRIDGPDFDPDADSDVESAPLSRAKPTWVPAAEARGEGIFIQFREGAIASWCQVADASGRLASMRRGHEAWRERRGLEPGAGWPGARYILLHSFAHALVNELAIECGYSQASLQERIYAREATDAGEAMAGVLLYTAASDSDGTLGGLVALGRPAALEGLLSQALERSRLCSADPLCAEHVPHETEDSLHNAACHACLFVPETTCERGNRYLDRSVLVKTLGSTLAPFFDR